MKRQHTEKFIMKLANELHYTLYDVVQQVSNFIGCEVGVFYAIGYLSQFNARSIRHILKKGKIKMNKYRKMWEWLVDMGIATEEELVLVTCLTGRSIETLNNVLFIRTGYRTREQYEYCELWDEEE